MPDATTYVVNAALSLNQSAPPVIATEAPDYLAITEAICCTVLWLGGMILLGYLLNLLYKGWIRKCEHDITKAREVTEQQRQLTHQASINGQIRLKEYDTAVAALVTLKDEYAKSLDEFVHQKEELLKSSNNRQTTTKRPPKADKND